VHSARCNPLSQALTWLHNQRHAGEDQEQTTTLRGIGAAGQHGGDEHHAEERGHQQQASQRRDHNVAPAAALYRLARVAGGADRAP
jgi:hypothetical protein